LHGNHRAYYEEEITGIYYNTAAVIDADGKYLESIVRTTSRTSIPASGKNSIRPGNLGYPTLKLLLLALEFTFVTTGTSLKVRAPLGLNGAEIVFNPSATVAGLSEYLWRLEQPAHAVANGLLYRGN